ncbi:MAG: DNA polymerase III subunit delta, partial [Bacteroidales bacterium]|nr:DNA polymerase III subunit delta [Bacteroidales bacterium]
EKVVDIASSYPMMADRRLVIVKDIHKYKAPALKHLAEYVAKPSKSTCLVVTVPEKIKSGKWINSMVSSAVAIDCRQLYENEIVTWIKNYVQVKKMEIEIQAVHLLQEQVGTSLLNLVNELEKVQVNIHPRTKISVADIQKITSISKQSTVFELCDAVGNKNFPKSISILNNLLDRGEKPTGVIVQLTRHLSNLLKIRESIRLRKSSAKELAAVTKVNPYFINKIKQQANNFKSEQLRQAFDYLATADLHLKTGYQQPKLVMELLLYNLIKI